MKQKYATGAIPSPYDIRTFAYKPTKANIKGGQRYNPEDIEDQHRVGICTAISLTQQARKVTGIKYSADFQYYLQKRFYDNPAYSDWQWGEGSSIFHALKVAKNIGLLPEEYIKDYISEDDRKLSYKKYVEKLKAIPEDKIQEFIKIAGKYKILAYQSVPVTPEYLKNAIDESDAGLLTRYDLGNEWWQAPIEPLRPPKKVLSGHAVIESNYNGNSFRIANMWGSDWADKGTAYRLHDQYAPTEAWLVFYNKTNEVVDKQLEQRKALMGQLLDLLQKLLNLLTKQH